AVSLRSDRGAAPSLVEIPGSHLALWEPGRGSDKRCSSHVDSARVGGVGVKNGAAFVLVEHAGSLAFGHAGIAGPIIVRGRSILQLLRGERHVKIVIEVVLQRRDPLEAPSHPLLEALDLRQWRARD